MGTQCSDTASQRSPSMQTTLVTYLYSECGICHRCINVLLINDLDDRLFDFRNGEIDDVDSCYCTMCLGLSSSAFHLDNILPEMRKSLIPYCSSASNDCNDDDANGVNLATDQESNYVPMTHSKSGNHLSRDSPTIQIPLLILVRAHCAVASAMGFLRQREDATTNLDSKTVLANVTIRPAEEVFISLKERIKTSLKEVMLSAFNDRQENHAEEVMLPKELLDEEAGYLSVHVIAIPPTIHQLRARFDPTLSNNNKNEKFIALLIPPSLQSFIERQKNKIQHAHYKLLFPRTRFRGNDPTLKQGGDPKKNLELRIRRSHLHLANCIGVSGEEGQGKKRRRQHQKDESTTDHGKQSCCTDFNEADWNTVIGWMDRETVNQWLKQDDCCVNSVDWLQTVHKRFKSSGNSSLSLSNKREIQPSTSLRNKSQLCCSIVATTWRKPFCIHGYYTKTRRDVSQTPFYVTSSCHSDPKIHDGPTSMPTANNVEIVNEMQIENTHQHNSIKNQSESNYMVRKGISSVEEEICPLLVNISCGGISIKNNSCSSSLVYGMCKFHASGREDMDVRMLLPVPTVVERSAKSNTIITGRPFVCEIYDAHRVPTLRELVCAENAINSMNYDPTKSTSTPTCDEIEWNQRGWPQTVVGTNRFYGHNMNGVGVSSLKLVSSKVFSTLQSETEKKIKHYGCICWSELPIESEGELLQKLGCSPWDKGDDDYPLRIQQSTPLRVLHRRSSDVRIRYILSLSATRIDRHWFRLRLSTSAGTYVKEFVHGDCGRTYPSVRSLLGGRTDITELDCEGIVFDLDESNAL